MKPKSSLRSFLALSGSSVLALSSAFALESTWTPTAAGTTYNWQTLGNWSGDGVPSGSNFIANLTNNIAGNQTVSLNGAVTLNTLNIGDSDNSHAFTLANGTGGSLTFDNGASAAVLTESGALNDTISATLTLNSNLNITANGSLTLNGITATSKTITKLGNGLLTISSNNASGISDDSIWDVQAGTLSYGNSAALGGAIVSLNGGNLDSSSNQNGVTANNSDFNWNQNWAWGGTVATFGLGSGAVTLGASTVEVTVNQNLLHVGGVIGDGGNNRGLTKAGIGTLVLGVANTYTGATTVTGGALRLLNDTSLAGGIGVSGGASALTLNGGVLELGASNFSRNLGNTASTFQITGGTSGFSSFGSSHSVTINNNAGQEVQWGSTSFMPGTLVLNDTTANAGLDFRNRLDLNGADRTIHVNANTAVISGDIRTSTGTAGLTKGGAGTLALTGTNTYNGATTVNAGVLSVGRTANLSGYDSSGKVVFNGGTVRVAVGGSGWTTGQVDTLLTNATKTSGAIGLDTSSGNLTQWTTFTASNLGALGLEKSGSNTLTLNQVNSYTGATTVSGGTLRIQNGTGLTQTLSGGLNIAGPDVTIHSHYNSGSGTLSTTFGALTRTAGSTVNFSVTGGTPGTDNLVNLTGSAGFVDVGVYYNGTDFAWRDSTNGFVRAAVYGTDVGTSAANALTASSHALMTSDQSFNPGGNRTLTSLKITGGADLTFTANARLLTNSILVSGGDSVINLGGGLIGPTSGGSDMIFRVDGSSDKLTMPGTVNNPAGFNVIKSGAGTLVVTGNLAQTGNLYVNGGTMELQGSLAAPTVDIASGATLVFNNSAAQTYGGGIGGSGNIGGGGNLVKNGTGTLTLSSSNSFTGTTTVSGGMITLGNSYALSGSTLDTTASIASSSTTTGLKTGTGVTALTFGGLSGNKNLSTLFNAANGYTTLTALTLNPGAGASPSYSGEIADGASGMTLTKTGAGTQILSGTNTYTGATTVSAGTLAVNGTLANTSTTVQAGATLQGSGSIAGSVTIQDGGTLAPGNSIESLGTGAVSFLTGSTYAYELQTNLYGTTPGLAGDLTDSTGTLDIQAGSILTLTDLAASTALAADSKLTLISYFGGWAGTELFTYNATTLNDGDTFTLGLNQWRFDYNDTTGGLNYTADQSGATSFVTMTVVPEPAAALLGSLGLLTLLRRRRQG